MRHYYLDQSKKTVFVYDTKLESSDMTFLGSSESPLPKLAASVFLGGTEGYNLVIG